MNDKNILNLYVICKSLNKHIAMGVYTLPKQNRILQYATKPR